MARLPIPGADNGSWGTILNDFLQQAHEADGTLKADTVDAAQIIDGTVTEAKLSNDVQTKLDSIAPVTSVAGKTGDIALVKADVGLASVDNTSDLAKPISTAVQTALDDKADTTHTHTIGDVTGLQTALDSKADSSSIPAEFNPIAGTNVTLTGSYPDITFNATPGAGVTDITITRDATSATVVSSTGADGVIPAADATNAGVLLAADKTKLDGIAAGATANSPDAQLRDRSTHTGAQAISTVTGLQTALDAKGDDSNLVHLTGNETIAGIKTFSSSPIIPTPTNGTDAANKAYVDAAGGTAPDATTSTKGIVQLAGDLAGTAASPTVPGKVNTNTLVFNVKDYGAIGDGAADDTAAIQATIDACTAVSANPRRGGVVFLPKGRYRITATLFMTRVTLKFCGTGWTDWSTGFAAGSYGSAILWDGDNSPMLQIEQCLAPIIEDIVFVGHGTINKTPQAAIRFTTTASTLNAMASVRRCLFGRYGSTAGMAGIVLTNGILFDGDNLQNDRGLIESCRFDGCTQGINLTGTQNVLHRIRACTFAECATSIMTVAQTTLESCYFSHSQVRDLDISTGARVTCDEVASEFGTQFARLRSGAELVIRGGYFQTTTDLQPDRVWLDASDDSRTSVRIKDFRLTCTSGYAGGVPILSSHALTNSTLGHKVVEIDGLRWFVGAPQTPGITESFFDVTPAGTNDSVVIYGRIQPGTTQSAGPDVTFYNLLRGTGAVLSFARDDRLLTSTAESDLPDVGEFVPDIDKWVSSSGVTPTSGQIALAYWTARRTEVINTMTMVVGATGAAATPTLIRFGIYEVASNGDLTLVASTANDTTLLVTPFGQYAKTLSASWTKIAGRRYATAFLVVTGATMPNMVGHTVVNATNVYSKLGIAKRRAGKVSSQSDLPASITAASVTDTPWRVGILLS